MLDDPQLFGGGLGVALLQEFAEFGQVSVVVSHHEEILLDVLPSGFLLFQSDLVDFYHVADVLQDLLAVQQNLTVFLDGLGVQVDSDVPVGHDLAHALGSHPVQGYLLVLQQIQSNLPINNLPVMLQRLHSRADIRIQLILHPVQDIPSTDQPVIKK